MQAVRTNEWRPVVLGGSGKAGVHSDVLAGRDWECGWEDVFGGKFSTWFIFVLYYGRLTWRSGTRVQAVARFS
jgi:proteasome maturation factor UMP1